MFRRLTLSATSLRLALALSVGLLLGAQLLETGHYHEAGLDTPECLQCQLDSPSAPLASTLPMEQSLHAPHRVRALPASEILLSRYRPLQRGPPPISG